MIKIYIFFITLVFISISCNTDDSPKIALPEKVVVQIMDYDITSLTVTIKGTDPLYGLKGKWSIENTSENGSFLDENSSLTKLEGTLFDSYLIRWTITNGKNEIYDEKLINISENFNVNELLEVGATTQELLEAGISVQQLILAGISINQLILNGVSIEDLVEAGAKVSELIEAGITLQNLLDAGVSILEIASGGISSLELINYGITKSELISAGIITEVPNSGFFILNFLKEKYTYSNADNFCNSLVIEDMNNWKLPTIEELRKIYNSKDNSFLEYTNEFYWSSTFSHNGTDENGTLPNYWTKNMTDGEERTYYGPQRRIIPIMY